MAALMLSRRSLLVVVIAAVTAGLVVWAAFSALQGDSDSSGSATITGELGVTGAESGPVGIAGSITIQNVGGRAVRTVATDRHGHFTVHVQPGRYELTGQSIQEHWPAGSCRAKVTNALAGRTTTVLVLCHGL